MTLPSGTLALPNFGSHVTVMYLGDEKREDEVKGEAYLCVMTLVHVSYIDVAPAMFQQGLVLLKVCLQPGPEPSY